MLVGGGELHEEMESLVRVEMPLSRGIERFTGITQAMVDNAPPPEAVLPEVAELIQGRVLVAHSAQFDRRALKQAFERCDLEWPNPPVICTVAMARRFAAVGQADAAAPGSARRGGGGRARASLMHTPWPADLSGAVAGLCSASAHCRRGRHPGPAAWKSRRRGRRGRRRRPDLRRVSEEPAGAEVYVLAATRARRPLSLGSAILAAHSRAGALLRTGRLDPEGRDRRLQVHPLRARRARAREPPDQGAEAAGQREAEARRGRRARRRSLRERSAAARAGPRLSRWDCGRGVSETSTRRESDAAASQWCRCFGIHARSVTFVATAAAASAFAAPMSRD